jgi:hypothetical protein
VGRREDAAARLRPRHRVVWSPLSQVMLEALEPECRFVSIRSAVSDREAARIAGLMSGRPDVALAVHSGWPRQQPVTNLDLLRFFPWITRLSVRTAGPPDLDNIGGLAYLTGLADLSICSGQSRPVSAAPLASVAGSLRALSLEIPVSRTRALAELAGVVTLRLRTVRMADLSLLAAMTGLTSLSLLLGGTWDLSLLPSFTGLSHFEASLVMGLAAIAPIGETVALEHIHLESLPRVTVLPQLGQLTRLRSITLRNMKGLTDLTPLLTAPALEEFSLSLEHLQPGHIAPLAACTALRRAHVWLGSDRKTSLASAAFGDSVEIPVFAS